MRVLAGFPFIRMAGLTRRLGMRTTGRTVKHTFIGTHCAECPAVRPRCHLMYLACHPVWDWCLLACGETLTISGLDLDMYLSWIWIRITGSGSVLELNYICSAPVQVEVLLHIESWVCIVMYQS